MNLSIFIRISLFNNTYLRYDEAIKVHILQVTVRDRVFFKICFKEGYFLTIRVCQTDAGSFVKR